MINIVGINMNIIEIAVDADFEEGTIVDVETTHWDITKGELITAGFLSDNRIKILQRVDLPEQEFKEKVIKELENEKQPLYAFHKKIEEDFLQISIEKDLQNNREAAFGALLEEGLLDHYNSLCDPLFNEEVPRLWNAWIKIRDMVFLSKIVRHNYCCLAKEYYLKLIRINYESVHEIKKFPSSAKIEKRHIRPQLGI